MSSPPTAELPLPPGDMGLPFLGKTLDFVLDTENYIRTTAEKYKGGISRTSLLFEDTVFMPGAKGFRFATTSGLFESDWPPAFKKLLGDSILLVDGDLHKKKRQCLSAAFTTEALESYMPTIINAAERSWASVQSRVEANPGSALVMIDELKDMFLDVSWSILIGENEDLQALLSADFKKINAALFAPPTKLWPSFRAGMEARDNIIREGTGLVQQRRQELAAGTVSAKRRDVISLLIGARTEEGELMGDAEIANELIMLIFAAFDTSATTATNFLTEVVQRPELMAKLLAEQARVESEGGTMAEQVEEMSEMEAVLKEVLRFRPPAAGVFRRCVKDTEFQGYRIPAGQRVSAGIWLSNRQKTITPKGDGESFCPMRYMDKAAVNSLTFGMGEHQCIGGRLAFKMLKTYLATFLRKFNVTLEAGQDLKYIFVPTHTPKSGLRLLLTPKK